LEIILQTDAGKQFPDALPGQEKLFFLRREAKGFQKRPLEKSHHEPRAR
jgi:hypothetical protein